MAFHSKKTGKEWHLTDIADAKQEGDVLTLKLVICSGDLCAQESFKVTKKGDEFVVEAAAKKKGFAL